jgi:hypothetical protein
MSYDFKPASMDGGVGLLIGIAGTSGSGKTYSAMQIAKGIVGPGKRFAVIDTEAGRALHYSKLFEFDHCELEPPFRPSRYLDAVRAAEAKGYKAIIIDSWSHCWSGEGGMHDWADEEMARMIVADNARQDKWGKPHNDEMFLRDKLNSASWQEPKIRYKADMSRLIRSKAHVIFCMRAEDKLIIEQRVDDKGRKKTVYIPGADRPLKDRYIPICCHNPEFMFELTLSFVVTPENPGVPVPIKLQEQHRHAMPDGRVVTQETGRLLAEWARGEAPATRDMPTSVIPDKIDPEALLAQASRAAANGNEALTNHLRYLSKAHQDALRPHAADLRATASARDQKPATDAGVQDAGQLEPDGGQLAATDDATHAYALSKTPDQTLTFESESEYLQAYEEIVDLLFSAGNQSGLLRFDDRNKSLIATHDGLADAVAKINARVRKPVGSLV